MDIGYAPFAAGPHPVTDRDVTLADGGRGWPLAVRIHEPAPGDRPAPLVIYSHRSGGDRNAATFLARHLASHGYRVAATDHSEVVALAPPEDVNRDPAGRAAWVERIVAARLVDVRLVVDAFDAGVGVALVGHSFGGWTVLAAADDDDRVGAVVAHVPAGSRHPEPGILPVDLPFRRGRSVPVLLVAGEHDVMIPVSDVLDVRDQVPGPVTLVVLAGADHLHFVDDVERHHEAARAADLPGDAAWIPAAMRPYSALAPAEATHAVLRAVTLAHLDAAMRGHGDAAAFLSTGLDRDPRVLATGGTRPA